METEKVAKLIEKGAVIIESASCLIQDEIKVTFSEESTVGYWDIDARWYDRKGRSDSCSLEMQERHWTNEQGERMTAYQTKTTWGSTARNTERMERAVTIYGKFLEAQKMLESELPVYKEQ